MAHNAQPTSSLCLAGLPSDLLIHIASFLPQPRALLETCKALYALRDRPELLSSWLVHNCIWHAPASSAEQQLATILQRFECTQAHVELLRSFLGKSALELWFPGLRQAMQSSPKRSLGMWIVSREHSHQPPSQVLRWLVKAAGSAGSIPVLSWALAIDTALPDAAFTAYPDLAAQLQPLPSNALRLTPCEGAAAHRRFSPSHRLLSRAAKHRLQRICDDALRAAASAGHLPACKLLHDHTIADEQAALGMLSETDSADALKLLLQPRPVELTKVAQDTHELYLQLTQLLEAAAQQVPNTDTTLQAADSAAICSPGRLHASNQLTRSLAGSGWLPMPTTWPSCWGFGVNISDVDRMTVPRAARAGAMHALRTLLALGARPFVGLVPAAEAGQAEAMQLLLDDIGRMPGGAALQKHAATGAIFSAARNGHLNCVKALLSMGADATAENQHALVDACVSGNAEVVQLLLDHGCSATALQGIPLATAALQGYTEVVKVLLRRGADPNCLNHHPLTGAACNGHEEVVRLLLEAGADPHAKEEEALNQAAHNGHTGCAQIIVQFSSALRAARHRRAVMRSQVSRSYEPAAASDAEPNMDEDAAAEGHSHTDHSKHDNHVSDSHRQADHVADSSSASQHRCSHAMCMGRGAEGSIWPLSKLPRLRELLARCPHCPKRTNPFESASPEHDSCPSGRELWEAARAELAANFSTVFGWYSIFCDGCNSLPVVGRRWRCRDCPRYYMDTLPSLQGFDLCDDCYTLHQQGKPLPVSQRHPTHCHDTHRMCIDRAPVDWNADLDNHSQMLVWLNCYEALHPEVDGHQLHHLAVMHVNKDPRRTQISTESLIDILAPGTTPQQWQSLLPDMPAPLRRRTTSTGGAAASSPSSSKATATKDTTLASHPISGFEAGDSMETDVGEGEGEGVGREDGGEDEDDNVWPSMPPPGYQPVLLWNPQHHADEEGEEEEAGGDAADGEGLGEGGEAAGVAVAEGGGGQELQEGGDLVEHAAVGAILEAVQEVLGQNAFLFVDPLGGEQDGPVGALDFPLHAEEA